MKSDDPEEGDVVASLSLRTGGNIKATRSFPVSGDDEVAEFKAGWVLRERTGQWLKTAAGTAGVQQDTEETWCAAAENSVDCVDGPIVEDNTPPSGDDDNSTQSDGDNTP